MPDTALLKAIDHLTRVVECAALGYGGELKSELDSLTDRVAERRDGYDHPVLRASLPALRRARELYRANDYPAGASELVRISRGWWQAYWSDPSAAAEP